MEIGPGKHWVSLGNSSWAQDPQFPGSPHNHLEKGVAWPTSHAAGTLGSKPDSLKVVRGQMSDLGCCCMEVPRAGCHHYASGIGWGSAQQVAQGGREGCHQTTPWLIRVGLERVYTPRCLKCGAQNGAKAPPSGNTGTQSPWKRLYSCSPYFPPPQPPPKDSVTQLRLEPLF